MARTHRIAQPPTLAVFLPWGIQQELVVGSYAAKLIKIKTANQLQSNKMQKSKKIIHLLGCSSIMPKGSNSGLFGKERCKFLPNRFI